jgi:two-component system, LuxR family, response regulator FixJ
MAERRPTASKCGSSKSYLESETGHAKGGHSRLRAEVARVAFALAYHAEVYSDLDELLDRAPSEGIVFAVHDGEHVTAKDLLGRLAERGLWLPVVMTSPDPALEDVVTAIRAGALDFMRLPLEMGTFGRRLAGILAEAGQHAERRRRHIEAWHAIATLSPREHEVLELLSAGCSNKEIAQNLAISPRTVEIHRANMMAKLRAGHAANAVRLWIDAHIGFPALPALPREERAVGNSALS